MMNDQKKIQHLLLRAGFGASPEVVERYKGKSTTDITEILFRDSETIQDIMYIDRPPTNDKGEVRPLKVVNLILKSKKEKEELNLIWLERMTVAKAQLREKMILFWHNHFATSAPFGWLMQVQHNMLRKHALGSFREMLHAISKDPAMIIWLNNQENKKNAPNENFAREVMELFTLGEGNGYTENDIKQAARAFTGWSVNKAGEYEFNAKQHDSDVKEIFGKKGNFNGEEVIDMLLAKPETATYICRKIWFNFVNHEPDEKRITELANRFRSSDYQIGELMKFIFNSDWFYEEKNIGCLIASPVELVVRLKKLCRLEVEDPQMLAMQDVLGQVLFMPPNVSGWKGGRNWIHSSSLVQRLHIPKAILEAGTARLNRRPAFEESGEAKKQGTEKVKVKSDWTKLVNYFSKFREDQLTEEIISFLIQSPDTGINRDLILKYRDNSSKQRQIITTAVMVMQLPEFQII
jgi:uncharacterized protein (DUF1800 family)